MYDGNGIARSSLFYTAENTTRSKCLELMTFARSSSRRTASSTAIAADEVHVLTVMHQRQLLPEIWRARAEES